MSNLVALYDACVLYPAELRNLLMYLAVGDLFRAKWTDAIHEEWIAALLRTRDDLTREKLERTRDLMNRHATTSSRTCSIWTPARCVRPCDGSDGA